MKIRDGYEVEIREAGPRLTTNELDRCEQRLHIRLPHDYRTQLLRTNGVQPEPGGMVYKGASLTLEYLFSINSPSANLESTGAAKRGMINCPTGRLAVATTKVAVSIESALIAEVDRLVGEQVFPNRSKAIQEALRDKLNRLKRRRLARESAKLDRQEEQSLADAGLRQEIDAWPAY